MMRRYRRLLLLALLIAAILGFGLPKLWENTERHLQAFKSKQDLSAKNIVTSFVYPLQKERWIKFQIPGHSRKVRILTNAHIDSRKDILPDSRWLYSIEYQLLSKDGSTLDGHVYHQRTSLTHYRDKNNKIYHANHFASDRFLVLDGREIILNLSLHEKVAFIRLRLGWHQPEIKGVAARLYVPTKISAHRVGRLWRRLSEDQQDALAKGSVYPAEMLSETEKVNLLKSQWQPLGPVGIKGRDYLSKTLYNRRNISEDKLEPEVLLAGLQADAGHPAVIPIPEHGGRLTLDFKMLDNSEPPESLPLQLRWFGRSRDERWQRPDKWQDGKPLIHDVDGGLLEIRPFAAVVIKAQLQTQAGETLDITPRPLRVKTYFADAGADFKISHAGTRPTAVRLDVRRFFSADEPEPQPVKLTYQWQDAKRNILKSGKLAMDLPPSKYDRLRGILSTEKISDPLRHYWVVPPQVRYLHIESENTNAVINVYNQPSRFIKRSRIPEDAYVSLDKKFWRPSWFPLNPLNAKELFLQQRLLWVQGQYRPPEDGEDATAGDYLWTEYLPEKPYRAYHTLSVHDKERVRKEALGNLYCELPRQKSFAIRLQNPGGLENFAPDLWFFNSEKRRLDLSVNVDGKKLLQRSVRSRQARMPLPHILAGKRILSLRPYRQGRWLLNNIPECSGTRYLKRRIIRLDPELSYLYQHQGEDRTLSARLYSAKAGQRARIKVHIMPLDIGNESSDRPFTRWTFKNRLYDIRLGQTEKSPLLHSSKSLDGGESFFIPFNHDLPAGIYRITFRLAGGSDAYLSLAQIMQGAYEARRFYKEIQFEN